MKRYLDREKHRLSEWEKKNLWLAIANETGGRTGTRRPDRRSFRPVFGLASVVAVLIVAFAWWIGANDPERGFGSGSPGVVVLPPEMKVDQVEDRDPALDLKNTQEMEARARIREELAGGGESLAETAVVAAPSPREKSAARTAAGEGKKADRAAANASVEEAAVAAVRSAPPTTRTVAAGTGMIRGRVQDRESGAALASATVLIRGTARSVATDSTGAFVFTGLQPGEQIELQVLLLNYAPQTVTVSLPDAGPAEVTVTLAPVSAGTLGDLDAAGLANTGTDQRGPEEHKVSTETFRKYAIDSVTEALSKQAGIVSREGRLQVRGGRENETAVRLESQLGGQRLMAAPPSGSGSVTGGTRPPNGEQVELMYFEHTGVNPFIATEDDSLSTFAVDVDNASWTVTRNYLRRGGLPPKGAVRVEEFVNAFDAGWKTHTDKVFRIHSDGSTSRFGAGYHLLRVGLVGKTVADDERKAANLVFVIDISGSMNRENRLGLVKQALHILLDELQAGDRVGIVVYGSSGRILLEPTDIERRATIEQAIDALGPGGSTNAFEGLDLAYAMARRNYEAGKVNRLILCSDGVANNGASTEAEQMLKMIRRASDEGVTLSTIGFGMGNYNDVLMEKLADQGDGNYYYVDELKEAERVFRENLTGLLQTIAREVKVQVEFDGRNVKRWRLLGYENRDVADRDFRNDAVDAGEVGSGHQVTALYEIKLADQHTQAANPDFPDDGDDRHFLNTPARPGPAIRLATVRLRYQAPAHDTARAGEVKEIESPILLDDLTGDFAAASVWLRTQAVAAEFAEILRGSFWAKESRLADLVPIVDGLTAEMPGDEQVKELAELIRLAADIEAGQGDEDEDLRLEPREKE